VGEPRVAGVLLAAGEGSRFEGSTHKLLADFRGRPLVAWAVDAMVAADLQGCCVVTGAVELDEAFSHLGQRRPAIVHNARWRQGQATSLQAGLSWCRDTAFEAAVIGLGDQPLVPAGAWRAVAAATVAPIVTASYGGRRRPPVRLDGSVWELLPTDGDEGARVLMQRRPDLVGEVACEGDPADVDTAVDLRRYGQPS
jgi:molybdenum cofactor cytidylyltransferase